MDGCCGEGESLSAGSAFADATLSKPFRDPYRGVRISLVEKLGIGDMAQARIKVTLPEISVGAGGVLDFGELLAGASSTKELGVANRSDKDLSFGQLSIRGRHEGNYSLLADECSNSRIKTGQSCNVILGFAASNVYPSPMSGEFGLLRIPLTDDLFDFATVDLWGLTSFLDLAVTKSHSGQFSAGRNGDFDIVVKNRGTMVPILAVTVTDTLPAGMRFLSSAGDWNCTVQGQEVKCTPLYPISPMGAVHLGISVAVDGTAPSNCTNIVVMSASDDPYPENNTASDTAIVATEAEANRELKKRASKLQESQHRPPTKYVNPRRELYPRQRLWGGGTGTGRWLDHPGK
jgi:uncharacterized repeat protein (TIGR01451 family)